MSITKWPESERPRERLLTKGAHSLSDSELLAIFLRTGIPGKSAVDLARDMLNQFGSLQALARLDQAQFCQIAGMGPAKFVQLKAVLEMAKRCVQGQLSQQGDLNQPEQFAQFAQLQIGLEEVEKFLVIGLDSQLKILAHAILSSGTLNKTTVYPREVLKFAIENKASRLLIAHNHPSGQCEPSAADDLLTDRLRNALYLIDVELVDHLIVSHHSSFSYRKAQREPF